MVKHTQSTEPLTGFRHTPSKNVAISSEFQCLISLVFIPPPFSLDQKARKKLIMH